MKCIRSLSYRSIFLSKNLSMSLTCSLPTCSYTTEEGVTTEAGKLQLLLIHSQTCHPVPTSAATPTRQAQAERVKRPLLNLTGQALEL